MSKQKIGPTQEKWIQGLEKNPEQQMYHGLGLRREGYDMFCILGKGLDSCGRAEFDEKGKLQSGRSAMHLSKEDVDILGLYDEFGSFKNEAFISGSGYEQLTDANDDGISWLVLALSLIHI